MKTSILAAVAALTCSNAAGQIAQPVITLTERDAIATLYATGEVVSLPSETRWRYLCGSDTAGLTNADLAEVLQAHHAMVDAAATGAIPQTVINTSTGRGGLDVIFNVSGSLPSGASAALAECESVIESNFNDNSTVVVSVSFQNLGGGVLGATGSDYVNVTYANARDGLQNGADGDDTVLDFLPSGTTIPVRYNASSSSVTNENRVFFTEANFKATVGSVGGTNASITINSSFNFDYNPANGVSGTSFNDVMIHEVGHAMGFTSGVDFRNNDIEALDIFRFQLQDGTGDYNPDTFAEFQTTPRTVDFNNPGTDGSISDVIGDDEWRMSDGNPWQASHFREQVANIGLMDPALSGGVTYLSRGYYADSDIAMFDAIGYDVVDGNPPVITQQPGSDTVCEGETAQLTIVATGDGLTYQWTDILSNPIPGATSPTLTITNAEQSDSGFYFCVVTGTFGEEQSDLGQITVNPDPAITSQPQPQSVTEGDPASFSVTATNADSFQWRFNGSPIGGATSSTYNIASTTLADAGLYTVDVINNDCGTVLSNPATLTVEPATMDCLPDVNGDGNVTPADFTAWIAAFNSQGPGCDQNGDTLCNPADFNGFILNYNAGCN